MEKSDKNIMTVEPKIYLDKNGITIKCTPNCNVGFKQVLNGVVYEVVDDFSLRQRIEGGGDMTKLCTSFVTDMSYIFFYSQFNQPIGHWDVSNVTEMGGMFGESQFNQPLSHWDVSNVSDMGAMFKGAPFNQPIRNWDVSNVTDMGSMFSDSQFDQPIGNWDVSNVTNMRRMFSDSKFNQPISNWDVSNVIDMEEMFFGSQFNQPIGNWDVSNVANMQCMFEESRFNQNISKWNVQKIEFEPDDFSTNSTLAQENKPIWNFFKNNNFFPKKNLPKGEVDSFPIDLDNNEFQIAFRMIKETNQSFFLTGKAGTGKSTFLKLIVESGSKNFVVVAPTGVAAVNANGVTIHSFFQFPLRPLLPDDNDVKVFFENSEKRKIIAEMDTLIIDEVSMVRADLIDGIDYSLRLNGGNPNMPFGGKQIVFVGDIFQLEPVTIKSSGEYKIIGEIYGSPYFYNAKVFEKLNLFTIELKKVYRQIDPLFISLLDKVRVNEISQAGIDQINSRVFSDHELSKKEFAITLTTKNSLADTVNVNRLAELTEIPFRYKCEVSGEFEESKYPTEPELKLKVGAQVIFLKNDTEKRWVNGTIGQVTYLSDNEIKVKLEDGSIYSVEQRIWENIRYQYHREKKKIEQEVVGTFRQYPLRLAWAITIHKSQGLTFDRVIIDFGNGTFASGQAYVALSRATTFEGLFLKQKINSTDIYVDEKIKDFAKSYNDQEKIIENLKFGKKLYPLQKNNNRQQIGYLYFDKAISHIKIGNFKSAYEDLILGFENISCDCHLQLKFNVNFKVISNSLKTKPINCSFSEINFIWSVFYFYISEWHRNSPKYHEKEYSKSLNYINSYLGLNLNSEVGHYLKGMILFRLENITDAITELEYALSIKKTSRVHYRLGRIKEETLGEFGIDHLYHSVLLNPSSSCALRWFKNISFKRGIKLQTNKTKILVNQFNNESTIEFTNLIEKLIKDGCINFDNNQRISVSKALEDFQNALIADGHLFGVKGEKYSNDDNKEEDDLPF